MRQWFSVFNGPNDFGGGARAKNFRCLESEPELQNFSSGFKALL